MIVVDSIIPGHNDSIPERIQNNTEEPSLNNFSFQLYPNPGNSVTHIKFEIPKEDELTIDLLDITGKIVERLFEFKNAKANDYDLSFTAKQAPGIYFVSIKYGDKRESQRLVIEGSH